MVTDRSGLARRRYDASGRQEQARRSRWAMLQAALGQVRAEPDPRRMLSLYGEFVAEVSPRHVPIQLLVRAAAATDPEAAGIWDQLRAERLAGMTLFARVLHQQGHLRPDVSVDQARDLLWSYNSPELYDLLVIQRGWSRKQYGRWLADTLIAALLP